MITDQQQGSEPAAAGFADHDLERLSRVLIDRSIDYGRDRVDVAVEHGWATVTGEVASARCKCDVERHVRSLAGIKGLTSHLQIRGEGPIVAPGWPLWGE
jgi:osmotically-inducible protein OsmY